MNVLDYRKAIGAIIATILVGTIAAMSTGAITPLKWTNIAISGVTAAMVFAAPNVKGAKYTKTILSILMAVLSFAVTVVAPCASFAGCHVSQGDLMQVGVIILNCLGVWAVPNSPPVQGAR